MPIPLGKPIQMNTLCDASHASDLVMRRSTTGFFIYLCGTPVVWYSKHQNTVESSTFGSEFVSLGIATDKVEALRTIRVWSHNLKKRINPYQEAQQYCLPQGTRERCNGSATRMF
jgi:hypothetical protein